MERERGRVFFFYLLARMKLKAVRKMRKYIDAVMKSCVERFLQEKKKPRRHVQRAGVCGINE